MKPLVTIIVAIYNAEKWLPRCLRSILAQTLENVEVLLINDGSTDSSAGICDDFAAKDQRIKVYHRQNSGVSATRQFGIDHATGDYLIYLDSDDFVDPSIYEKMYRAAERENADLVVCDWFSVYGDTMYAESLLVKGWDCKHLLYALIQDQPTYQTIFLFRRTLFDTLSVGFPNERVTYGEDTIMLIDLLSASISSGLDLIILHIPEPLYYYDRVINPGSLMKLSKEEMNRTRLEMWTDIGRKLSSPQMKRALNNRLVSHLFISVWNHHYPDDYYVTHYSPLLPDIKQFASPGIKKFFVCRALNGQASYIMKHKAFAFPIVIQERWGQRKKTRNALPVQKELVQL